MKIKVIGLVLAIFIIFLVSSWAFETTDLAIIQKQHLHWNYFSHVIMILLGISAIAVGKQNFKSFGFSISKWRSDLRVALICVISTAGYIPSLIYPPIAGNVVINTLFHITAALLALRLVITNKNEGIIEKPRLPIFSLLVLVPLIIAGTLNRIGSGIIASTIVFQFYFAGFGEEILFRGYIQSKLNEDFGRPWRIKSIYFGPGLLITSALFGVLHLMNPFNPLIGKYELDLLWGISSFFFGMLFGFVREKTGTILSAGLGHGFVDLGQVIPLLF